MAKSDEVAINEWAAFIGGIVTIILLATLLMWGDTADIINTKHLGKEMCEEHNLTYDHRELYEEDNVRGFGREITIYCTDVESRGIEDGYLVKI